MGSCVFRLAENTEYQVSAHTADNDIVGSKILYTRKSVGTSYRNDLTQSLTSDIFSCGFAGPFVYIAGDNRARDIFLY